MMHLNKTSIVPIAALLLAFGAAAAPMPSARMQSSISISSEVSAAEAAEETIVLAVSGMT